MAPMFPTGTVTFLFSDIEGSTALWEDSPEAMRSALAWHDRILRSAIETSRGCVVKNLGDGVYAAFGTPKDALTACLDAQRALQAARADAQSGAVRPDASLALKVRMGLHSGSAELRDGDYFGAALNRAARIMSVAHGEQVLLSATTAELIGIELPDGIALREMGEHRLKGLPHPERLLQVVAPGLRAEFPPLASQISHSLPAERDAFVGRRESLEDLARRLAGETRLVSIIGVGGTGKTRLVTRFGWGALESFPGGVWFCDLSEARSLDGILHAVAQGLALPPGKDDPVTQIGHAIAGRGRCLVILDNFEQVARYAEETLGAWLNRAGGARFLATTREVLGLPGEEIVALAPLAATDAAALFVKRAEAAKSGFMTTAEDQAAIAPLVKLLDGLPLAIELAAARVRVMAPRTLLQRMTDRFRLLTSSGGRLDRQATLRAVFDWSWDLLSLPEKAALAQLSVFEGGFTLDAAEAVLDLGACDAPPWAVDVLQSLVQKSLVRQVTDDRFDLLVSVQEYATQHLRTSERYPGSGPTAALAAEARHGTYFATLDDRDAMRAGAADLDNLVAACRRAAARHDGPVAASTLERAWAVLALRGPFHAARELAALVAIIPALEPSSAARTYWVAGCAETLLGKTAAARAALSRSVDAARECDDRICEARALLQLGALHVSGGQAESARQLLERALASARALGDSSLQSEAENRLGNLEIHLGRPGASLPHYEAALGLARAAGDRRRECSVLANLGTLEVSGSSKGRRYSEAALSLARECGDRRVESNSLCNLGLLHYIDGRLDDAREHLDMALLVSREIGNVDLECNVLCNLGMVQQILGQLDDAEADLSAALVIARELQNRRSEGQILGYLGVLHAHRGIFDEARRLLDAGEALLRAVSDPVSLGVLLCNRCEAERLAGAVAAAETAFAAADAIAREVSVATDSELNLALLRLRGEAGRSRSGERR